MKRRIGRLYAGIILALFSVLLLLAGCQKGAGSMAVYGVNTGKADCLLFCLPNGESLMVDTGLKDTYPKVKSVLEKAGVKKLDHVIITHGHKDHIGGLKQLAEDFKIGTVYTNAYDTATYSNKERQLLSTCAEKWDQVQPAVNQSGRTGYTSLLFGDVHVDFLAPDRAYSDAEDDNNNSLVLRLVHGKVTFLLMGDATVLIEEALLSHYGPAAASALSADFLKAGRHGKADANTQAFINAVSPAVVYITGSRADDPDSVDSAVLDRYAAIGAAAYINEGDHLAVRWVSDGTSLTPGEYVYAD